LNKVKLFLFISILFLPVVNSAVNAKENTIIDFDNTSPYGGFIYKDEKGTAINRSSAYSDPEYGRVLGIKYKVVSGGFAGWGLGLKSLDVSDFKYIVVRLRGKRGGENFELGLRDTGGKETNVGVSNYRKISIRWQELRIPLSDFKGINLKSLDNFHVTFPGDTRGMIYIDEIKFMSDEEKSAFGTNQITSDKVLIDGFERINPSDMYIVREGVDASLKLDASRIVRAGDYSMQIEYSLETDKPWGTWAAARLNPVRRPLDWSGVNEINMWVYGDGTDNILGFRFEESSGEEWYSENDEILENAFWGLAVFPVNSFKMEADSEKVNSKIDLKEIVKYEIYIKNKTGTSDADSIESDFRVYVDQLYLTGKKIKVRQAAPEGIVRDLTEALPSRTNVDFSGVVWTEYRNEPDIGNTLFHWAKLAADARVNNYIAKFELSAEWQNFGDAAYYTNTDTDTTIGTQGMNLSIADLHVEANDPLPYITNLRLGNIWVSYTPYTFTGVWGYKGMSAEGSWFSYSYHTFFIKNKYDSYAAGTRIKFPVRKLDFTGIAVYSRDSAKVTTTSSIDISNGIVSDSEDLIVEPIADDLTYTIELKRKLLSNMMIVAASYGKNEYNKYSEADYSDPYNPTFVQYLENNINLNGDMYKFNLELKDSVLPGLSLYGEYRDIDENFRPKYRQSPTWFDEWKSDQRGYNIMATQWHKGFVFSFEYEDLDRKAFKDGYRYRTRAGAGYYGLRDLGFSYHREYRRDRNNTSSSRSNFSALDRNEEVLSNELYVRSQLQNNIVLWFKIWGQNIRYVDNGGEVFQSSLEAKAEYRMTSNTKLFAEYKHTKDYSDNCAKVYLEIVF